MYIILFMNAENLYSFPEAAVGWLASKPALAKASRSAYQGEISRLAEHLECGGVQSVQRVCREDWWRYLVGLTEKRSSVTSKKREALRVGSVHQARRITRDFFMWALEQGLIDWLPKLPELQHAKRLGDEADVSSEIVLGDAVIQALLGEGQPQGLLNHRAQLVLNLIFWGALKPQELVTIRVQDCSWGAKDANLTIKRSGGVHKISLPSHIFKLWEGYLKSRCDFDGREIKQSAPLISKIETEAPLSAWGVWSVFNDWQIRNPIGQLNHLTPRKLRAAYLSLLCQEGEQRLGLAYAQVGIKQRRVTAWEIPPSLHVAGQVNEEIRIFLTERGRL